MYNKLFIVGLLISASAFGQDVADLSNISSPAHTITIQHQTTIEFVPDEIEMNIVLLEYVKTDPETQQTSTIEMAEIEKQFLDKLKPYGISKSDLSLSEINDQVQANNNVYGYTIGSAYTTTQKRLIRKTYSIIWTKSIEELQPFMEALRFNGIQSLTLQTSVSDKKTIEIQEKLLKKVMTESEGQAQFLATNAKKSLGEIISFNINPASFGSTYDQAIYPNYANYNFYGSNNGNLNKSQLSMSISAVYELK